jgi:predicted outer membrane repeat protein
LRNGFVSGDGAGIHNENAIELDDCVVSGNTGATRGGGIYNNGVVILNRSTLTGNTAASGGGIFDDLVSAVYATDCAFSGNHALGGSGGGIAAPSGTVLEFTHCTFTGNTATGPGGAIGSAGMLSLDLSTVQGNTANDSGGGVYVELNATASVSRSTISGNVSHNVGGGICFFATTLTMLNSTIALNEADADGGGIYSDPFPDGDVPNINIYSSTIVFNDADHDRDGGVGGGIYVFGDYSFNLYNTVVAGNTMGNQPLYDDCDTVDNGLAPGTLKTHARNLFGTTDGCNILQISGSYALLNSLALLGQLQDNGGPTKTIALLAGSNAINGTSVTGSVCRDSQSAVITVDQRGFLRNDGTLAIVGAYEYNDIFANGFEVQ